MAVAQLDVSNQIIAFKRKLAPRREALKAFEPELVLKALADLPATAS